MASVNINLMSGRGATLFNVTTLAVQLIFLSACNRGYLCGLSYHLNEPDKHLFYIDYLCITKAKYMVKFSHVAIYFTITDNNRQYNFVCRV